MRAVETSKGWSLKKRRVLRRVLGSNPGQEYYVYVPSTGGHEAPMFVAVHGVARNAREQAKLFAPHCETHGAVLVAPHFSAEEHADYQRLGRVGRGGRADATLDAIVEESAWLTGASPAEIYLFGFSGGAQFAHRYTMAHPHRVARTVMAAAGWYTFPDARMRFPYGIGPSRKLAGVRFDPEEFLRVPITVLVGDLDTTNENLRRSDRLDRQQGTTRVERARSWVRAMQKAAAAHHLDTCVELEVIAGMDHSFEASMKRGRLGERVFAAMFETPDPNFEEGRDAGD
jgi:pimeloyl-ACP methyl ester carboxylesterase